MAATLFDHLSHIFEVQDVNYYNTLSDEDRKTFSVYMINRFISMNKEYLPLVNEIQQYWGSITPREVYLFYSNILPKKKQFNRYVKGVKETQFDDSVLELLSKHFRISISEAGDYLNICYKSESGKEFLREFFIGFGYDKKQLKKIDL